MSITKKVLNQTRGTVIAERAEVADTTFKRLKGLLGRKGLEPGQGLIIMPCSSIHTFFMKFPIDIIFLDRSNKVTAITESLPRSKLFGSWLKGKLVIELPAGTISASRTRKYDSISIG